LGRNVKKRAIYNAMVQLVKDRGFTSDQVRNATYKQVLPLLADTLGIRKRDEMIREKIMFKNLKRLIASEMDAVELEEKRVLKDSEIVAEIRKRFPDAEFDRDGDEIKIKLNAAKSIAAAGLGGG
jgi:hypothetical protein